MNEAFGVLWPLDWLGGLKLRFFSYAKLSFCVRIDSTNFLTMPQTPRSSQTFMGIVASVLVSAVWGFLEQYLFFSDVTAVRANLKPGDIIEFHRGFFSHYALYLGEGKVMNVCAEDKHTTAALITVKELNEVCGNSRLRIRNHDDVAKKHFGLKAKPTVDIIKAARSYKNQVCPYQFLGRNCEYYSTLWRYGKGFSTQAANPGETPVGEVVRGILRDSGAADDLSVVKMSVETQVYNAYKKLA
ncbi:unnamed protein product [Orchesella dallaii]|uniref:LRAT domain-containing protein n=1 Tax=Orchesella dallaii TaxID=48710 RepID=A0ABP1QS59_9HEXA